jgi:undecaprenyl diphosphate synthase
MTSDPLQELRSAGEVPGHVAIIMDGNGRWARQRGLPRHAGHREGMKSVREAMEGAIEAGIRNLTLFAFSTENWSRPPKEISALMGLLELYARKEREDLCRQGVEVRVLGQLDRLGKGTRRAVNGIMEETEGGEKLRLNLMISYSGRKEIVRAVQLLAGEVLEGRLTLQDIDDERFEDSLFTRGLPDPDLLIRTSGEMRISNFMLWQLAYTECHVTPVLWPDFTRMDLFSAVLEYQRRDRRFGRVTTPLGE